MSDVSSAPPPATYRPAARSHAEHAIDWRPPEEESRGRTLLFRFLPLLFLCAFAFGPAWSSGEFLWQDDVHVTANNPLRSAPGLALMWTAPSVTPEWAPLSYSLLWPQHFLWQDKTPSGYHLVSLFLHAINALLVWMLLRRLEVPGAFLAAMLFAVHPVQTEAVGWISQQPLLFGAMWSLCFLLVAARWTGADVTRPNATQIFHLPERPRLLFATMAVTYLFAVLSSPLLALPLPIIAGLWGWWRSDESMRTIRRGMAVLEVFGIAGAVVHWIAENRRVAGSHGAMQSLLLVPRAIAFYLSTAIWPTGLTVVHRLDVTVFGSVAAGVVIVAVLAGLWVRRETMGRTPFVVAATYLLLILPMVTPLNRQAMQDSRVAERFQYLAIAVVIAGVVGGIAHYGRQRLRDQRWIWPTAAVVVPITLATIVCVSFAPAFASKEAMWNHVLTLDPDNVPALIFAAQASAAQKEKKDAAIGYFSRVLQLTDQKNVDALIGLGDLYGAQNDMEESTRLYDEAQKAAPGDPRPVEKLGEALMKVGHPDDAFHLYGDALKRFPNDAELWRGQGDAYLQTNKIPEALQSFKQAVAINKYDAAAHLGEASCYLQMQDGVNFKTELDTAFKLDPMNYDFFMTLATMCVKGRAWESALIYYHNASYLKPDAPEPANNVGLVLAMQSQQFWAKGELQPAQDKAEESEVYLKKALELKPDFLSAQQNLEAVHKLEARIRAGPPPHVLAVATQPSSRPTSRP